MNVRHLLRSMSIESSRRFDEFDGIPEFDITEYDELTKFVSSYPIAILSLSIQQQLMTEEIRTKVLQALSNNLDSDLKLVLLFLAVIIFGERSSQVSTPETTITKKSSATELQKETLNMFGLVKQSKHLPPLFEKQISIVYLSFVEVKLLPNDPSCSSDWRSEADCSSDLIHANIFCYYRTLEMKYLERAIDIASIGAVVSSYQNPTYHQLLIELQETYLHENLNKLTINQKNVVSNLASLLLSNPSALGTVLKCQSMKNISVGLDDSELESIEKLLREIANPRKIVSDVQKSLEDDIYKICHGLSATEHYEERYYALSSVLADLVEREHKYCDVIALELAIQLKFILNNVPTIFHNILPSLQGDLIRTIEAFKKKEQYEKIRVLVFKGYAEDLIRLLVVRPFKLRVHCYAVISELYSHLFDWTADETYANLESQYSSLYWKQVPQDTDDEIDK